MSSEAMKWAKLQSIESGPLSRALDVLAQLANERQGHSLFHSQATIAARLHCSVRTARNLLADLETLKVIQRARRSRGRGLGRTTDLIRLRTDQNFTFTKDQIRTLLQAAKVAGCNRASTGSYNRQISHLQPAETAGDRSTSDQQKEVVNQEGQPQGSQSALGVTSDKPALRVVAGGRA